MKKKRARLFWRREPREKGLAGVCQGERGYHLMFQGSRIGSVNVRYGHGFSLTKEGYYWSARLDVNGESKIPLKNTCNNFVPTIEQAKAECEAYVRSFLDAIHGG